MTLTRGKSLRVVPKYWPEVKPKSLCKCFCECLSAGFILWASGRRRVSFSHVKVILRGSRTL